MQDVQTQAINNYEANIEFFKTNNEAVYNKILALETMFEEGTLTPKYDLIYENDYFDIVELHTSAKLYNTNSKEFSKEIVNSISLQKNQQSFRSLRKLNFEKDAFIKIKDSNAYTNYTGTAEILETYYNNTNDTMHMKEIEKFIFIGVGLGLHIPKAIQKFEFQIVLIVEDNLELFRLSLFTINYKDALAGTTSYFSIANTPSQFRDAFNGFYTNAFFKNQYIKFHLFSSAYESKIEEIRAILISRPEATYSHNRILEKNRKVLERINEQYKFLDLQKKDTDTFFQDKPWLVLGAGPSLHKNADWIVKNQDKFVIIAAFTALSTLKRIGVTPDIAVQIDENVYTTHEMIQNLGDLSFLDDTLLFFSASVSPELFEIFSNKENIYLHEDRTKYKLSKSTLTVSSVGDSIHALALIFNAQHIYLLGIDLALGENGLSHSPDHFKANQIEQQSKEQDKTDDFHLGTSLMQIKGNFRDTVDTTPLFALSIPVINYFTRKYKTPTQMLYNLSDGCFLESTIPLQINEVPTTPNIEKTKLRKDLRDYFDALSSTALNEEEINGLYCRKAQIKDFYKSLEVFSNTSHANSDIFLGNMITLARSMFHHSCAFELKDIMSIYFLYTTPYIDDFLNTQEIKNPKKFTKKFKNSLSKQIYKIIETYDKDLHLLDVLKEGGK